MLAGLFRPGLATQSPVNFTRSATVALSVRPDDKFLQAPSCAYVPGPLRPSGNSLKVPFSKAVEGVMDVQRTEPGNSGDVVYPAVQIATDTVGTEVKIAFGGA